MQKLLFFMLVYPLVVFGNDVELSADNGLEWDQEKMIVTATLNAQVKRNNLSLTSDKIFVKYRNKSKFGKAEIFLISAEGNVIVQSPKEQIKTDYIEYNLDDGVIIVKSVGKPITMKAYDADIFAYGKIIYYERQNYAIVNKATVLHSGRSLSADIMKLEFNKLDDMVNKSNVGLGLSKIIATGHLTIKDKSEVLTGNVAVYDNKTGIASIDGDVQLSRGGGSRLQGGKIEYNMKTGIARLLPDPMFGRVVGIFKSVNEDSMNRE